MKWKVVVAAFLVGCAATPVVLPTATITKARPTNEEEIDEALFMPCPIAKMRYFNSDEMVRVANARAEALTKCNEDKAKLREAFRSKKRP